MLVEHELKSKVKQLGAVQPWWHDIELPHGVRTIDRNSGDGGQNTDAAKWKRIAHLLNYRGKSVVDVPCNDGYYSIKVLEAGASYVLAMDIDAGRVEKVSFVRRELDLHNMDVRQDSVYNLPKKLTAKYDIALCLGLLHRVPDPYGLMQAMLQTAETVVVEWPALLSRRADARFWGGTPKEDFYNTGYWELSRSALADVLSRLGARHVVDCDPCAKRAIFVVTSSTEVAEQVRMNIVVPTRRERIAFMLRVWREAVATFAINVGWRKTR